MAQNVTLSAAVRTSLLSLQGTTKLIDRTQNRLSTGLEVGGPVDDAVAYFQSKGLSDRATDFSEKKSNIDQGISSLSSAIEGINGVESLVRQLKGLALNAKSATSETISGIVSQFNDLRNQINYLTADSAYQGLNLINGTGSTLSVDFSNVTSSILSVASVDITVGVNGLDLRKAATANGGFNLAFESNTGTTLNKTTIIETQFAGTGTTISAGTYTVTYGTSDITFTVGTAGATRPR
jgi:flagellin-like hook-associated protein FlgL